MYAGVLKKSEVRLFEGPRTDLYAGTYSGVSNEAKMRVLEGKKVENSRIAVVFAKEK